MAKTFDYAAFKAAFRASAKAHGIDPVAGATSYQAANLKADLRKAEMIVAPDYGWATANGRNIFSDEDKTAVIVVVAQGARPVPTWLLPTAPSHDWQMHKTAWEGVATGGKPRAKVLWRPGAVLPEREFIAT